MNTKRFKTSVQMVLQSSPTVGLVLTIYRNEVGPAVSEYLLKTLRPRDQERLASLMRDARVEVLPDQVELNQEANWSAAYEAYRQHQKAFGRGFFLFKQWREYHAEKDARAR